MSFKYILLHTFGLFLIISNFYGTYVLCDEDNTLKGTEDDVINILEECGYWDEKPPAPWTVAIYHKKDNNYKFRCIGSIITSTVVITAANCIIDEIDYKTKLPADELFVAAGKKYNDYNAVEDKLAQKSEVNEYYLPAEFYGRYSNYRGDLAVLIIKNPFYMTNIVQPICLDRNNNIERRQVTPNNKEIVIGWISDNFKTINQELQHSKATYISNKQCLDLLGRFHVHVTADQFCANYITRGNSGGGIAYKWYTNNKQQFYIRGVNTLNIRSLSDVMYDNGIFTNITFYKTFILKIIDQQFRTDSCPTFSLENGQFRILGQNYKPTDFIPNYHLVRLSCNKNYKLHPATPLIACNDGEWNVPIPQCKLTCAPITSSSVEVKCIVDNITVNCSEPLVEGAVAKSKCKPFYTHSDNEIPISSCVRGTWSNPLVKCVPECGEVVSQGTTLIINSTSSKKGEFPWHIALYRLMGDKHQYLCGGSIITPLIIITAAICFTNENGLGYPAEEYYIGAGKYYSDYNSAQDLLAQKRQVKEYHIPPQFRGYDSSYAGDLAVVVVKDAFKMTNVVQPVCMDWNSKTEDEQLKQNNIGSVVGWGFVDPNAQTASAELQKLNPPFINEEQCITEVPTNFRRWITPDKFCAGFLNGSSICKGDSGGGLVFTQNTEKYFLRGLASIGPVRNGVCDAFQYGVYTKISVYNKFILNIVVANQIID